MRRILNFPCEGATLAATLDDAAGTSGLLIVSGGNEIRIGAHRGMAELAAEISGRGYPVFRFDRRGIGDSEGENGGFVSSGPDIAAAAAAFRAACPSITQIVAFGNCDAASAIVLHQPPGVDVAVLSNIWVIERQDEMPPPAAIKARYLERLKDPRAWIGLFTGAVNLRKLASGLFRLAKPSAQSSLPDQVANGIATFPGRVSVLLAERDATALAFIAEWDKPVFAAARARPNLTVWRIDSASHSFASAADHAALIKTLQDALSGN
jgi:exosortase A-associated hydrolase 1